MKLVLIVFLNMSVLLICILNSDDFYGHLEEYSVDDSYVEYVPAKDIDVNSDINVNSEKIRNSVRMHKATSRQYSIFGRDYEPVLIEEGSVKEGVSSWYGPGFHTRKTSSGETYNMHAMTAAHRSYPMNTVVRVTNKRNGKSVVVRINDRGPFIDPHKRIIDLSNAAAKAIEMDKVGLADVIIEVISVEDNARIVYNKKA